MSISHLTVDVSNWPDSAIDKLLGRVRDMESELRYRSEKPEGFEARFHGLKTWGAAWTKDLEAFRAQHAARLSKEVWAYLERASYVVTVENGWLTGAQIWREPYLGYWDHFSRGYPPTFDEFLKNCASGYGEAPRGIGKKTKMLIAECARANP